MIVVGISALFHDSACAVMVDGRLAAAAQEERFSRRRFDPAMPAAAFRACLRQAGVSVADVNCVSYYEKPAARLSRQLWSASPGLPPSTPGALFRLAPDRPYRQLRETLGYDGPVVSVAHHEAHAASAFYFSGFAESALFTADAVGEWTTTSYGRGGPAGIELMEEVSFPHSLGLLYSTVTSYLGFAVNSDEYKVMGLAPYGEPRYTTKVRTLVTEMPAGQFRLEPGYFTFAGKDVMYTPALCELFGAPPRAPHEPLTGFHQDVARSLQVVTEEIVLTKLEHLYRITGCHNLSYAGGVALNCVANARVRRHGPFADLFIPPAAGDAGGSAGAAAIAHHQLSGTFTRHRLDDARLGPDTDTTQARACLDQAGIRYDDFAGQTPQLLSTVARLLAAGNVVGWCRGRMEFGPRALGARSILADPRKDGMRAHINSLVKQRESFRPFAPAVVAERADEFFDLRVPSPFMLETAPVRDPTTLPAVTHVDGSARLQTVDAATHPDLHGLLTAFGELTGYPVLLNTSFNIRGEPIVADVADAMAAFVRCRLDAVVLGDILLRRDHVPAAWAEVVALIPATESRAVSRDVYTF